MISRARWPWCLLFGVTLVHCLSGGIAGAAWAQAVQPRDSVLEARTSALASQLRCPVCQGVSIQDSPAELAQQMRSVVREQLAAGKTPAEIKAYFVASYGEWVLLEPRARGLNLLIYVLPALLLLGGIVFVARVVRRWTSKTGQAARAPGAS